jgi:hypothetical protein
MDRQGTSGRVKPLSGRCHKASQQLLATHNIFAAREARYFQMIVFKYVDFDPFSNERNKECDRVGAIPANEEMKARRF